MDIDQIIQHSKEPEVTKAVFEELKKYGDDVKKNYNELRTSFEDFKKSVDESEKKYDTLTEEKMKKYSEDIITRQQKLDELVQKQGEEFTKRTDDLEVMFKRPGVGTEKVDEKEAKEAEIFLHHKAACEGIGSKKEITPELVKALKYGEYKYLLEKWARKGRDFLMPEETRAMMVGSDPDGGYVVPVAMGNMIIQRQDEMDPIRALASIESVSTGAIEYPIDYDETESGWETETVSTTEKKTADLGVKRIVVHPLGSKVKATQTLIEDASINIEQWLSRKAADKFARDEGAAFVTGNGVGKPRGFLTYSDYTTAGTDEYGKVEQIHMGNATALTADGFISVKFSMVEPYLSRGTWLMNRSTVAAALKLKDGNGQYIWSPGLTTDSYSTILNLPVRMSTTMPAVAASALSVALADWKEAYMIVDRIGISVLRDPYTEHPFILFRFRKRVGGDVTNFQAIKIGTIEA